MTSKEEPLKQGLEAKVSNSSIKSIANDESVAEVSPDGRFLKFDKLVGDGSFKTVYMGCDTESGVNVAWCELKDRCINEDQRSRFKEEAEMLKKLNHPNVVKFYDFFEIPRIERSPRCILVTELLTSGTLKTYIKRFTTVKEKILKNWCRQILRGLNFLHSRQPPIIHRDLKCDNIFINGSDGNLKLGDLGLATFKKFEYAKSVIGTPEFMAPEMYDECYDEAIDIYAFGMCMLEMTTGQYPYMECSNAAQIFRRVSQGVKPNALELVQHPTIKEIIQTCIQFKKEERITIKNLLSHDFFKMEEDTNQKPREISRDCSIKFELLNSLDDVPIHIQLCLELKDVATKQIDERVIEFKYFANEDAPEKVAEEMLSAKLVPSELVSEVKKAIQGFILGLKTKMDNRTEALPADGEKSPVTNQRSKKSVTGSNEHLSDSTAATTTDLIISDDAFPPSLLAAKLSNQTTNPLLSNQPNVSLQNGITQPSDAITSSNNRTTSMNTQSKAASFFESLKNDKTQLSLNLIQVNSEGIAECCLECGNKTKLTFKFSVKDDSPKDVATKLIGIGHLSNTILKKFIDKLKNIVARANQLISSQTFGVVEDTSYRVLLHSDSDLLKKSNENTQFVENPPNSLNVSFEDGTKPDNPEAKESKKLETNDPNQVASALTHNSKIKNNIAQELKKPALSTSSGTNQLDVPLVSVSPSRKNTAPPQINVEDKFQQLPTNTKTPEAEMSKSMETGLVDGSISKSTAMASMSVSDGNLGLKEFLPIITPASNPNYGSINPSESSQFDISTIPVNYLVQNNQPCSHSSILGSASDDYLKRISSATLTTKDCSTQSVQNANIHDKCNVCSSFKENIHSMTNCSGMESTELKQFVDNKTSHLDNLLLWVVDERKVYHMAQIYFEHIAALIVDKDYPSSLNSNAIQELIVSKDLQDLYHKMNKKHIAEIEELTSRQMYENKTLLDLLHKRNQPVLADSQPLSSNFSILTPTDQNQIHPSRQPCSLNENTLSNVNQNITNNFNIPISIPEERVAHTLPDFSFLREQSNQLNLNNVANIKDAQNLVIDHKEIHRLSLEQLQELVNFKPAPNEPEHKPSLNELRKQKIISSMLNQNQIVPSNDSMAAGGSNINGTLNNNNAFRNNASQPLAPVAYNSHTLLSNDAWTFKPEPSNPFTTNSIQPSSTSNKETI